MTTLQEFKPNDNIEDISNALQGDGAVIIHNVISNDVLQGINNDIDPLLAAADPAIKHLNPALDAFFGNQVRHVTGLAGKSTLFAEEVMCNPLYLGLCDQILLPHCADYILNLGHVMDRGEDAEQQWLHRDDDVWIHCPRPHPEIQIASIVALVDFTRENGATTVIPGSNNWPRDREAERSDQAYAEMPAGSAVIYLGSTLHGGGTNSTKTWRRGLHLSYCHGWLRTEENNILAVPPAKARLLSSRAQQLLGYGVHDAIDDAGGYLGMVGMRNPQELLNESTWG